MKRKHYDLIIAWANGAEIQFFDEDTQEWTRIYGTPKWNIENKYRIKPEPKPDIVISSCLVPCGQIDVFVDHTVLRRDNIILTFCGETGNLKAAEVIQ